MPANKKEHPKIKSKIHERSQHRERYDFPQLIKSHPALKSFVKVNEYGDESVDFFNAEAVKTLNTALLKFHYGIDYWLVPKGYLCPPIPGRADYIHHIADLLGLGGEIPKGKKIKCLDVGVGANCIYPIIGQHEYQWSFVGSDIDLVAIENAQKIVDKNPTLKEYIELRHQKVETDFFKGIIQRDEKFDLSICNPPFHSSQAEAMEGNLRKIKNLKGKSAPKPVLNFGGQSNELWCEGGEEQFVTKMIFQSRQYTFACLWFSTLISKEANLKATYAILKRVGAKKVKTVEMGQGNKVSRIVAWSFMTEAQHQEWKEKR